MRHKILLVYVQILLEMYMYIDYMYLSFSLSGVLIIEMDDVTSEFEMHLCDMYMYKVILHLMMHQSMSTRY